MFRRTLIVAVVLASLAFSIQAQQQRRSGRGRVTAHSRRAGRKPALPPVRSFVTDSGGRELIVRVLDTAVFGRYLDSLNLNNSTIDVVILSHQHLNHYTGLRELFKTERHIRVRSFFENKDPATASSITSTIHVCLECSLIDSPSPGYRSDSTVAHGMSYAPLPPSRAALLAPTIPR